MNSQYDTDTMDEQQLEQELAPAGVREYQHSAVCERCFDQITDTD